MNGQIGTVLLMLLIGAYCQGNYLFNYSSINLVIESNDPSGDPNVGTKIMTI